MSVKKITQKYEIGLNLDSNNIMRNSYCSRDGIYHRPDGAKCQARQIMGGE